MPPSIHLRPAIPTDLPILTTILIAAFAPGPWSTLLFPPNLRSQTTQQQEQQQCRTTTNEEFNWRLRTTAAQLGRTGHAHVVATSSLPEDDGEILGWAHWIDKAVAAAAVYGADEQQQTNRLTSTEEEKKRTTTTKERGECASLGGCPTSPELDTAALARMGEEGAAVEVFARAALGEQRWENSFGRSKCPTKKSSGINYLPTFPRGVKYAADCFATIDLQNCII